VRQALEIKHSAKNLRHQRWLQHTLAYRVSSVLQYILMEHKLVLSWPADLHVGAAFYGKVASACVACYSLDRQIIIGTGWAVVIEADSSGCLPLIQIGSPVNMQLNIKLYSIIIFMVAQTMQLHAAAPLSASPAA
jgi:hypothetical protein